MRRRRTAAETATGVASRTRPRSSERGDPKHRSSPARVWAGKVAEWLELWWSPQQIAERLHIEYPHDPIMRVSHQTNYMSLFVERRCVNSLAHILGRRTYDQQTSARDTTITALITFSEGYHSVHRLARLNRLLGYSADLLGASSWLWRFKHNHLHHGNPNVVGVDSDIRQAPFARLAPGQPWRPWHRYQHFYVWFPHGFLTIEWLTFADFSN